MEYSWDYAKTKMLESERNVFVSKTFGPDIKYRIKNKQLQCKKYTSNAQKHCSSYITEWSDSYITDKLASNYTWEIVEESSYILELFDRISPYCCRVEFSTNMYSPSVLSIELPNKSILRISTPKEVLDLEIILADIKKTLFPPKT